MNATAGLERAEGIRVGRLRPYLFLPGEQPAEVGVVGTVLVAPAAGDAPGTRMIQRDQPPAVPAGRGGDIAAEDRLVRGDGAQGVERHPAESHDPGWLKQVEQGGQVRRAAPKLGGARTGVQPTLVAGIAEHRVGDEDPRAVEAGGPKELAEVLPALIGRE